MKYLITFSYDGSKYSGYQKQPKKRTIQNELEKVLTKINSNKKVTISASGRTDAGVHAYNQKAHFSLDNEFDLDKLKHSINSLIPDDIYIKNVTKVDDDFHARFSVKAKEYIYKINIGEYNPIEKDYIFQYNKELDIPEMEKALKYLEGTHDFKSFVKAKDIKEDTTRTIIKAKLIKDHNLITISLLGTGFMRYMVRNIVGMLIEIGEGKRKSEDLIDILNQKDRTKAGMCAKACGLYLNDVYYE